MSETELRIEKKFEKFREGALPHKPEETKTDVLAPPRHWTTQIYEDEYKPLPTWLKSSIKYGIIVVAILIALNHGSRHARSSLCQWGWQKFCEVEQTLPE